MERKSIHKKIKSTFIHMATAGNVVSIRSTLGISASAYNRTIKEIKKYQKTEEKK